MSDALKEKEEFRRLFKKYRILTTGKWTQEDEEELNRECDKIEAKSALLSSCIVGIVLTLFIILLWCLVSIFL